MRLEADFDSRQDNSRDNDSGGAYVQAAIVNYDEPRNPGKYMKLPTGKELPIVNAVNSDANGLIC